MNRRSRRAPRVNGRVDWNKLCGKIKSDGNRCMRPKGCRLRHRGPAAAPAKQAVNLALSLSEPTPPLGRSPAPLTHEQFDMYSDRLTRGVLQPLGDAYELESKLDDDDIIRLLNARTLLDEMNARVRRGDTGFTLSDRVRVGPTVGSPQQGHCVTLPGSHLLLPEGAAYSPNNGEPSVEALEMVEAWLDHLQPALESDATWIGGFMWDDEPHDGKFEINVTLVFPLDQEEAAAEAASVWRQNSYYTIDPASGGGRLVETFGDGGQSIYEPRGRLRAWRRRQTVTRESRP